MPDGSHLLVPHGRQRGLEPRVTECRLSEPSIFGNAFVRTETESLVTELQVSHALALYRGIIARPRGPTRLEARENAFTQARF